MARLVAQTIKETNAGKIEELEARAFGKRKGNELILSPEEALYLMEKGKLSVTGSKGKLSFEKLFEEMGRKDSGLFPRFCVFKHLREQGYVARPSAGTGFSFRVWARGQRPGEAPSTYLVSIVRQTDSFRVSDIAVEVKLATGLRKKLVWALVNQRGEVTFFDLRKTRF